MTPIGRDWGRGLSSAMHVEMSYFGMVEAVRGKPYKRLLKRIAHRNLEMS